MAGTLQGGLKAAKTNKARYGNDYYVEMGRIGGRKTGVKGFAVKYPCYCSIIEGKHFKARCAGKVGGVRSKRGRIQA